MNKWKDRKKMHAIQKIREEFAAWGYPLDNLSDEEIIDGVVRTSTALKLCGISMSEAVQGIKEACKILNRI